MNILDDMKKIKEIDKNNMVESLIRFPVQCEEGYQIVDKIERLKESPKDINKIAIAGMGGSAISGDVLRVYLLQRCKIPVVVIRSYNIPHFIDKNTLFFASSYSGNTEETMSAYRQAKDKGAFVISITTGGKLEEKSKEDGVPVIKIPTGFMPRAAVGYLFFPLLRYIEKSKILTESVSAEVDETIKILAGLAKEFRPETPSKENFVKNLAMSINGKMPIIYGSQDLTEVAAVRWKGQFNENSKTYSSYATFPELNHNEIVAWVDGITEKFFVILLRDSGEHPQVKKRFEITKDIISRRTNSIIEIPSRGKSDIARLFSLMYTGDFTSYYLSILKGIDPFPVDVIEELKKRLA